MCVCVVCVYVFKKMRTIYWHINAIKDKDQKHKFSICYSKKYDLFPSIPHIDLMDKIDSIKQI